MSPTRTLRARPTVDDIVFSDTVCAIFNERFGPSITLGANDTAWLGGVSDALRFTNHATDAALLRKIINSMLSTGDKYTFFAVVEST